MFFFSFFANFSSLNKVDCKLERGGGKNYRLILEENPYRHGLCRERALVRAMGVQIKQAKLLVRGEGEKGGKKKQRYRSH